MTLLCRMVKGYRTGHCRRCPFTRSGDISKCGPSCAERNRIILPQLYCPPCQPSCFGDILIEDGGASRARRSRTPPKRYRQRCWQSDHDVVWFGSLFPLGWQWGQQAFPPHRAGSSWQWGCSRRNDHLGAFRKL